MRLFLIKSFVFLCPIFILFVFSFFPTPEAGDLVRIANVQAKNMKPDLKQEGVKNLHPLNHAQKNVLIIGDSFTNRSDPQRNFQNHLSKDYAVFTFCNQWLSNNNPFQSLQFAKDSLKNAGRPEPSFVIIQSVERALLARLKSIEQDTSIREIEMEPHDISWQLTTSLRRGWGFTKTSFLKLLGSNRTSSKKALWLKEQHNEGKPTLVYADDLMFGKGLDFKTAAINLPLLTNQAQHIFPNARILVLVIPDKTSALSATHLGPFFASAPDWNELSSHVLYPIQELQDAISLGTKDVYRNGDTHLGELGAKIVASSITVALDM